MLDALNEELIGFAFAHEYLQPAVHICLGIVFTTNALYFTRSSAHGQWCTHIVMDAATAAHQLRLRSRPGIAAQLRR
ncbi:hypothetical protein ACU4GD_02815 [Cupriavidus basilensis]